MRVAHQLKSRTATSDIQERDRNELSFAGAVRESKRSRARAQERRAYARAQMALSVSVLRVAGQPNSPPLALRTIDISSSGASFLYPQRIELDTPLRIEVTLIEESRRQCAVRMCTDAHVVRAQANGKPGWHVLAVAFDEIGYVRDGHLLTRSEPPAALPHSELCD